MLITVTKDDKDRIKCPRFHREVSKLFKCSPQKVGKAMEARGVQKIRDKVEGHLYVGVRYKAGLKPDDEVDCLFM